jgi:hypothetical protein
MLQVSRSTEYCRGLEDAIRWGTAELPHTNRALFRVRKPAPLLGKTLNMAKAVAFNMKKAIGRT